MNQERLLKVLLAPQVAYTRRLLASIPVIGPSQT